jgi:hypothetical protein
MTCKSNSKSKKKGSKKKEAFISNCKSNSKKC